MDVRNCKMCGKLFNYTQGMPICKACEDELEKKFFEVRDYIYMRIRMHPSMKLQKKTTFQ